MALSRLLELLLEFFKLAHLELYLPGLDGLLELLLLDLFLGPSPLGHRLHEVVADALIYYSGKEKICQ